MIRALMLALVVLVAGGLTEPIPMAVLAGIAVYVGFNILDWSFIQRAHKVSFAGMAVMYGVMLLTVFVDLSWLWDLAFSFLISSLLNV